MRTRSITPRLAGFDCLLRCFWLALVAVHVAPLVSVAGHCRAGFSVVLAAKLLGIALSMGFFAAKAAGAPFLRVRCGWTGAVVFLLTCSLVHQSVRAQVYADPAAVVAATSVVALTRVDRRRIREAIVGAGSELVKTVLRASAWQKTADAELGPGALVFERVSAAPRGPPAI